MHQSSGRDSALERSALIVATLTSFMGPFMISSVNVALPAIQADLQMDAVQISWISTAYLLAVAVGLVPAGKIADIHGRKNLCYRSGSLHNWFKFGGFCKLGNNLDRTTSIAGTGGRNVCYNWHGNHYIHLSAE